MKKGSNIIFIGMSAAGKSTIGVVIAKRLGYEFIDTDLLIQKREKRLLKEILEQDGNDRFLEIENEVNSTLESEHTVISPGGSVIYAEESMTHFKNIGTIVYLQASFETINARIKNPKERGIVLKEGQSLQELYDERTVLFERYADLIVNEDGLSLEETIERVLEVLQK
ncbi:MAG TPA: shikimate kinase [Lachnospiraceae bacterium]|nr:shikimate kinase [Lachnospiraceae bacterium]